MTKTFGKADDNIPSYLKQCGVKSIDQVLASGPSRYIGERLYHPAHLASSKLLVFNILHQQKDVVQVVNIELSLFIILCDK